MNAQKPPDVMGIAHELMNVMEIQEKLTNFLAHDDKNPGRQTSLACGDRGINFSRPKGHFMLNKADRKAFDTPYVG